MSKWIHVEDKLPDDIFDFVLVYADGAMNCMAYTKENGFYNPYNCDAGNIHIDLITHWMPLPDDPLINDLYDSVVMFTKGVISDKVGVIEGVVV